MQKDYDILSKINYVIAKISDKDQLSTIDLALIYNLCDDYIKQKLGVDMLTIYDKCASSAEEITKYLMFKLYSEPLILDFIKKFNLFDILGKVLFSMGNKKVLMITDDLIKNSNKTPHQVLIPNDAEQIKRIFASLKKNYFLYEELYKDKVWLINSSNNSGDLIAQAKIKISPYMFFHLMGFDYKNFINPRKKEKGSDEFSKIFPNPKEAMAKLTDFGNQESIYYIIEKLLESEDRFLSLALEGKLANTVNVEKIEMKCYSFERMGAIEGASGMILFDKQKVKDEYAGRLKHINTDIILLNDFIRKYDLNELYGLDFVFSPFNKIKGKQVSDQQSIFLTSESDGGLNSGLLDGQVASISSSAVGYRENDFNYIIERYGSTGSETDPIGSPSNFKEFSEEDRKRVAQTIIEGVPGIDTKHLEDILKNKKR